MRMPELGDYWKLDPVFNYPPIASRIDSRKYLDSYTLQIINHEANLVLSDWEKSGQ